MCFEVVVSTAEETLNGLNSGPPGVVVAPLRLHAKEELSSWVTSVFSRGTVSGEGEQP